MSYVPRESMSEKQEIVVTSIESPDDDQSDQDSSVDVRDVQDLLSLYSGQLTEGCHVEDCRESMCRTGRLNTAKAPVRVYKHRSARAIALTICAGPNPRRHLCPFYDPNRFASPGADTTSNAYGPRDESSLVQRLCDTGAISRLAVSRTPGAVIAFPEFKALDSFHKQVTALLDESVHKPGKEFRPNADLAQVLVPALEWLLERLPLTVSMPYWRAADRVIISKGKAYAQMSGHTLPVEPENCDPVILDSINHEPNIRLLERICRVVAKRTLLEKVVADSTQRGSDRAHCIRSVLISRLFAMEIAPLRALALLIWLKRAFAKHWNAQDVVRSGSTCHGILAMIDALYAYAGSHRILQGEDFYMPMISSYVSAVELAQSWLRPIATDEEHLLLWNFMLSVYDFCLFFRTLNHLLMRRAHSEVSQARQLHDKVFPLWLDPPHSEQSRHERQYYLLVSVSRNNILQDAFDQLWQRRKSELRRPLRVRLGEVDELEVGHDLGGVQIEFFNLVCREVFSEQAQLFTTDSTTGCSYFRPGCLQPLYMFELVGLLMALAIYNGITLPVNLPWVFYYFLAHNGEGPGSPRDHITLEKIVDCWPTTARSLQSILDNDVDDLELEYSFPLEANGLRLAAHLPSSHSIGGKFRMSITNAAPLSHHEESATAVEYRETPEAPSLDYRALLNEWPGWHLKLSTRTPKTVTSANKDNYVQAHIKWLTCYSVLPQLTAFLKGFHSAGLFEPLTLQLFGMKALKAYVEGSDTLDINDLRAATRYDGYDAKSRYITSFWDVVTSWSQEKQKQLLKFVTAAERIPITGASQLTFVIKRGHPESLNNLPTSSTCFGTLILPKYASVETLKEKLSKAVEYGAVGFGNG
ncbi:unnamed protein product [Zymoseptoria tritici ST99CH_1A5]|uniref:HECT-type E3 ubiquitin transferase n=5 Tax=Zymoseptoria tritici TaxID=1047171 RepID=A0A1X7RT29_ZYMT9|nr:unnamed protein product [Zymoseptoria tritici ST99CH_3D7]SMR51095.1 unnamed protein product [Zymoseptoria tritici ST99CH_1E4]SMR52034.1 unnamed protein product [Zymoseptoria tritici ST99CH_3D1]SMY23789.1 unnamed protein product [Zymoseptoria tritici ST99CH_1A5]